MQTDAQKRNFEDDLVAKDLKIALLAFNTAVKNAEGRGLNVKAWFDNTNLCVVGGVAIHRFFKNKVNKIITFEIEREQN